jgi:hypothetical protein
MATTRQKMAEKAYLWSTILLLYRLIAVRCRVCVVEFVRLCASLCVFVRLCASLCVLVFVGFLVCALGYKNQD